MEFEIGATSFSWIRYSFDDYTFFSLNDGDVSYEDGYDYEDYYDGYEEDPCGLVGDCDFYDNDECANQCHHNHFPTETIEDVFQTGKISTCCSSHSYIFRDNCEVNFKVLY